MKKLRIIDNYPGIGTPLGFLKQYLKFILIIVLMISPFLLISLYRIKEPGMILYFLIVIGMLSLCLFLKFMDLTVHETCFLKFQDATEFIDVHLESVNYYYSYSRGGRNNRRRRSNKNAKLIFKTENDNFIYCRLYSIGLKTVFKEDNVTLKVAVIEGDHYILETTISSLLY